MVNKHKEHEEVSVNMNIKEEIFSFKGRIRRSAFVIRYVLSLISFWIVMAVFILGFFIGVFDAFFNISSILDSLLFLFPFFILLLILPVILVQTVKRLHDLDKDGFWALLWFVPPIGFVFLLYLVFADGTVGPNRYGEDPKGRTPYHTTQSM
jgi:uncharacterized membrane protein YhaH (DUF805 family)